MMLWFRVTSQRFILLFCINSFVSLGIETILQLICDKRGLHLGARQIFVFYAIVMAAFASMSALEFVIHKTISARQGQRQLLLI